MTGVLPGSPADELDLAREDVVTKLNGNPVFSAANLAQLVAGTCALNDKVTIEWVRDGETHRGTTTDRPLASPTTRSGATSIG